MVRGGRKEGRPSTTLGSTRRRKGEGGQREGEDDLLLFLSSYGREFLACTDCCTFPLNV